MIVLNITSKPSGHILDFKLPNLLRGYTYLYIYHAQTYCITAINSTVTTPHPDTKSKKFCLTL